MTLQILIDRWFGVYWYKGGKVVFEHLTPVSALLGVFVLFMIVFVYVRNIRNELS